MQELEDWIRVRSRFATAITALSVLAARPSGDALCRDLIISEILASNGAGLADEDGDHPDWIEVQNVGAATMDLEGWSLTDDPDSPAKWSFPSVHLPPGEPLIVFASGKDRADPASELHASFQLDAGGEYLGLFRPNGSPEMEFFPSFPPQREDISWGLAQGVSPVAILSEGAVVRMAVPSAENEEDPWTAPDFDDSGWLGGTTGVGLDLDDPGPTPMGGENVARGGIASQSSTGFAGFASRAIDGNTDGVFSHNSTSHTAPSDPQPWWQVDLQATHDIDRIVLWNRTDCCEERLTRIRLLVLDDAGREVYRADRFTDGSFPETPDCDIALPAGTRGRTVRIERLGSDASGETILSLAEVQVFERPAGFRAAIATDVKDILLGKSASLRLRLPFDLANPESVDVLRLEVRYDDGFVAWLNGVEIARRNAPARPSWDAAATAEHPDAEALAYETLDVTGFRGLLRPGTNVLAVLVLNVSADDGDLLMVPRLSGWSMRLLDPRYFTKPTPGRANPPDGLLGFVSDPTVSVERGFFEAPFDVAIATATPGAEIRTTTDGSVPTETTGGPYTGPIRISKTTTLRAAAFLDGWGSSAVSTHTYVFPALVVHQKGEGFPATWGGTPADYEMDPNVVDAPPYRDTIRDDLLTIPTLSIVMDVQDLFGPNGIYSNPEARGSAWERPCSMELIYPDRRPGLQVDCGVQIFGYGWRSHSATLKHALRLLFRRKYGPPKLRYPFFPGWPVEEFDDLVLRSQGSRGWNDFRPSIEQTCYIRDAWARWTAREMGKITTSTTHVNLYLNGLYWGLYNPVEHPDAEFLSTHIGGSKGDYDALNARVGQIEVIDGTLDGWSALLSFARGDVSSLEAWNRVEESLDVTDLADYMLIQFYTGNQDWPGSNGNNMRVVGAPSRGVGYKSFCWDMEYSIWYATDNILAVNASYDSPATLHARLRTNPEYRMLFADRVRKHLFGNGALTPATTAARWLRIAGEIDRAVVGESARWGDRRREPPYTRDVEWVRERNRLVDTYFPQRTGILLDQLTQAGLYPKIAAPEFTPEGGAVGGGVDVTIQAPGEGTILYRTDGGDPRLPGGAVAPESRTYGSPLRIAETMTVRARVRDGSVWSALAEARFAGDVSALRVTEIMYHPPPTASWGEDDLEFIEIQNTGDSSVVLSGVSIAGGVEFTFPEASPGAPSRLEAGAYVLVVGNPEAFEASYGTEGLSVAGRYAGNLSNAGEALFLYDPLGNGILGFAWDDAWYQRTDGGGYSLEVVESRAPAASWGSRASWRESAAPGGSPGRAGDAAGRRRPSDVNEDGTLDISDAIGLLGHLFLGTPAVLPCGDGTLRSEANLILLDANGDGRVDLTDAIHVLAHLFGGGPPPAGGAGCTRIPGCSDSCAG